ncbi:hypothetical protein BN13_560002 [Nostocoides jenkinsii Ben 74]|uniref:Uncharacterized protein n=1 Tax=Nostocoides jenkinsii Ben 74 TaxID=1193518 RepID=A0A077M9L6_9MICO|nr:hypothetical protein BN13_560002 [Tetrasphaera jenkinsii Ben 74]
MTTLAHTAPNVASNTWESNLKY